ncbi:MAG: hypothetical protein KC964_23575 [Candidatus Omnitrophica bacterium]|nr:hypothetical protein [Candidatus Omnitrophota bacterium]
MKTLYYDRNIKGKAFQRFIPFMGEMFPVFSLTTGRVRPRRDDEDIILERFDPFLIEKKEVLEWPGTRILPWGDGVCTLYKYRSCDGSLRILVTETDRLFNWNGRGGPGDLAFYREDGTNSFGTVAHEGYCFFNFTKEELERLKRAFPYIRWNVKKR